VDIHFADRDGNARRQTQFFRPRRAQCSGGFRRIESFFVEAIAQLRELRVEQRKKFLVGQTAPLVGVERLVPGATDTADDLPRIVDAGEDRRNPIGQLDPGVGGRENFGRDIAAVPNFGPKPFRRVGVAALGDELRPMLGGQRGDLGGLTMRGVVLPQPTLRVEILLPLRIEGERAVLCVDRDGARSRRVDAEADDLGRIEAAHFLGGGQRALHAFFQPEEVVAGILAGEVMVLWIKQDALLARRIVDDAGAEFCAVCTTHDERAD
jgi:hypothetical protein